MSVAPTLAAATLDAPRLPAALGPELLGALAEPGLLTELVDGFGSPLNVLLPQRLSVNVAASRRAFAAHPGLRHRVFLAHKPNRSAAVIRQAAVDGVDLDVASEGELRSGLTSGFPGHRMEATGPKNLAFLRLALQHGVLVNADSHAELRTLDQLHRSLGLGAPAGVVVRVSGIGASSGGAGRAADGTDTKFGVPVADVPEVIGWLLAHRDTVDFRGFAFHEPLSGGRARAQAAEAVLELQVAALAAGLTPTVLNVGGGFRVSYLDGDGTWEAYLSALKAGLLRQGPALTWNGAGLGMEVADGRIAGASQLARFVHTELIEAELTAFLDTPLRGQAGRRLGEFLVENLIEVHIEPGRAMYDQVGLTLARVTAVKHTPGGEWLVGLDMNRSNLDGTDREFFVDPIVLARVAPAAPLVDSGGPVGVYFGGNLCLPGDLILRHKTFLDRLPVAGDVVVFPNTAAYFMDFAESATLMQRTAAKVAVVVDGGRVRWARDDDYAPILRGATP